MNENQSIKKSIYRKIRYMLLQRGFNGITASQRKLPNFLVIGGKRCGTTTLFEFLRQHPRISNPIFDHMGFFDDNFRLGINYYKSFFPIKTKKNMNMLDYDVTTSYLTSPYVPERIKTEMPEIKIIVLLRNPTARAWSDFNSTMGSHSSLTKFTQCIDKELEQLNSCNLSEQVLTNDYNLKDPCLNFLKKGLYAYYLKKWFKLFPRKNFLILPTETFSKDENYVFEKIFDFLELPNFQIQKLQRMSKGNYQPLDSKVKNRLDDYFAPINDELFKLINQKFEW